MAWQDFEAFAVKTLCLYYQRAGFNLVPTPLQGDQGRDGNAILILGPEQESSLAVVVRLWVEVKQRTRVVGLTDLGGHILLAFLQSVTKLVFVTNSTFSPQLRNTIEGFASRLNFQYALFTGADLLKLARSLQGQSSNTLNADLNKRPRSAHLSLPTVALRWTLSPEPAAALFESALAPVKIPFTTPVYLVAELEGLILPAPTTFQIVATPRLPIASVLSEDVVAPRSGLLAQGDCLRLAWPFWIEGEHPIDVSDFSVHLLWPSTTTDIRVRTIKVPACHRPITSILGRHLPASRQILLKSLTQYANSSHQDGGCRTLCLLSAPGSGKSHMLQLLRQCWLRAGTEEIYIEGGVHSTDRDVFSRVCEHLLPRPPTSFGAEDINLFSTMLTANDFPPDLAAVLAHWMVSGTFEGLSGPSEVLLGRSLGRLLAARSRNTHIIISFDDLHKARTSVLLMCAEALKELRSRPHANTLFVFASRERSASSDSSTRALWQCALDELLVAADARQVNLPSFSELEATELVRTVVPRLLKSSCMALIQVVGRTPLALREGLAYLRDTERIVWDKALNEYLPRGFFPIDELRSLDSLSHVTEFRIKTARERLDPAVVDYLDAAACLGRTFRDGHARSVITTLSALDLESGIGELERLEILRPSRLGTDWIEFDHDLIRHATLAIMPRLRHRRLASELLNVLDSVAVPTRVMAQLAYQAGRSDLCLQYARSESEAARKERRFADEAEQLALALAVADPSTVVALGLDRERLFLDDAVALASPMGDASVDNVPAVEVCHLLQRLAQAAAQVSSGSGDMVERAATEALMLAHRLGEQSAIAKCASLLGRVNFERDRIVASVSQYQEAENAFAVMPLKTIATDRASNLVRLAIARRELGALDESRRTLDLALELAPNDVDLRIQAITNLGASYFHVDWNETRRLWTEARALSRKANMTDREIHLALDLNRLDLLEGRWDIAKLELEQLDRLLEDLRLDYPRLRLLNQFGVLYALMGSLQLAERFLRDAESYAVQHRAIRRLWKIRANLATLSEALGAGADAYAFDVSVEADTSRLLNEETLERSTPQRAILPIANIILRDQLFRGYADISARLTDSVRERATALARAVDQADMAKIPFSLARHCVLIQNVRRFVLA